MDKKEKSLQETESEDELPRLCPSKQEEWKQRLIEVDAVSVLLRYGWKLRCFKVCFFFHDSISQDKKLLLMLLF